VQGFHHRGEFDPPEWANNLKNYYWYIRVEGRDKAKRRKYYRYIAKEKIRLSELGLDQELIILVCRYLSSLKNHSGVRMVDKEKEGIRQLAFDFK